MKKLTLSIAAIAAMGTFAVAGGDIAPVEPVVDTPVVVPVTDAGFYIGAGYSALGYKAEKSTSKVTVTYADETFNDIMLQAGYKINPYFAIEGRYWIGMSSDVTWGPAGTHNTSVDAWGIYAKPMYPVNEQFNVYALLGYGAAEADVTLPNEDWTSDSLDSFSWGLGAAFNVNSNISLFVDYVSIYSDTDGMNGGAYELDRTVDTWNFGVTYKF